MTALAFPDIDPIAFSLGPFAVRWYGLAYFAGILLGWLYARRLVTNERVWGGPAPISAVDIDDFLLWLVAGIVLGGRIGYALFYQEGHFLTDPMALLRLWEGGMSFHGGMLGTILAMVIFARRRRIPILSLLDVAAASVPFGLCLGRIANFINGELWGRVTEMPWAIVFCNEHIAAMHGGVCPAGIEPRHPSQLYEAALEGVAMFLVLRVLTHHLGALRRPGVVGGAFVGLYGLMRITVEFFREPDQQLGYLLGPLTMGMLLSLPMIAVGAVAVVVAVTRPAR